MSASAILRLQKVGFTSEQVEALADFMDDRAASKVDVESSANTLKSQIETVEHRLELKIGEVKAEIEAVEHRLELKIGEVKAEIERVEHRLETKIAEIGSDMRLLEQRMTVKFGGMLLALAGILLAAIRYLPPHP